jgi:hypothetical protein
VFDAIATLDGPRHWWTTIVTGSAAAGGELRFGFAGLDEQIVMRVDAVQSPVAVGWSCVAHTRDEEWTGTELRFELADRGPRSCDHFLASLAAYAEPAGVAEPVHRPPGAVAEAGPQHAGDHHREQHVERDRAEAQPERPVRRGERHDGGDPADRREGIEFRGQHVRGHERHRQQRKVAVQPRGDHPRPARRGEPGGARDSEHDRGGQQDERHHAGGSRGIPQRARPGGHDPPDVVCGGADVVAGGCAGCCRGDAGALVGWLAAGWLAAGCLVVGWLVVGWVLVGCVVAGRVPPGCAPAAAAR